MGICIKSKCEQESRLLCFSCLLGTHKNHIDKVIRIKDIFENKFSNNWPDDQFGKDVKQMIQDLENFKNPD
jgi:hypothetical protein